MEDHSGGGQNGGSAQGGRPFDGNNNNDGKSTSCKRRQKRNDQIGKFQQALISGFPSLYGSMDVHQFLQVSQRHFQQFNAFARRMKKNSPPGTWISYEDYFRHMEAQQPPPPQQQGLGVVLEQRVDLILQNPQVQQILQQQPVLRQQDRPQDPRISSQQQSRASPPAAVNVNNGTVADDDDDASSARKEVSSSIDDNSDATSDMFGDDKSTKSDKPQIAVAKPKVPTLVTVPSSNKNQQKPPRPDPPTEDRGSNIFDDGGSDDDGGFPTHDQQDEPPSLETATAYDDEPPIRGKLTTKNDDDDEDDSEEEDAKLRDKNTSTAKIKSKSGKSNEDPIELLESDSEVENEDEDYDCSGKVAAVPKDRKRKLEDQTLEDESSKEQCLDSLKKKLMVTEQHNRKLQRVNKKLNGALSEVRQLAASDTSPATRKVRKIEVLAQDSTRNFTQSSKKKQHRAESSDSDDDMGKQSPRRSKISCLRGSKAPSQKASFDSDSDAEEEDEEREIEVQSARLSKVSPSRRSNTSRSRLGNDGTSHGRSPCRVGGSDGRRREGLSPRGGDRANSNSRSPRRVGGSNGLGGSDGRHRENDPPSSPLGRGRDNQNPPQPRRRRFFTEAEKNAIKEGVKRHGEGNWTAIKADYPDILAKRTNVQIKDKWRTMKENKEV